MTKRSFVPIGLTVALSGAVTLWVAIHAPARAVERNLAAVNAVSAGETTEAQLLSRKEFQTIDRMCDQETCVYHMEVENRLLSTLHLAPHTFMWAVVQVSDGVVTSVSVNATRAGLPAVTVIQVPKLPKGCLTTPCLKRWVLPNKTMTSFSIYFDSQSDLRNHMPQAINAQCWSRLHGCATYAELVPLSRELNLDRVSETVKAGQKNQP